MDLFTNLATGFGVAFAPPNLLAAFVGCLLGTLVGVLPGVGVVAAMAMLLPATTALPPVPALILLAGAYCGAQYGGSAKAILVNVPGEAATLVDGWQMALQGRAGPALAAAAVSAFCAGCLGTLIVAVGAAPLTQVAFHFGPAEYFSLMVLALVAAVVLASGSLLKAIGMVMVGMLLGIAAGGAGSGAPRLPFEVRELAGGMGFIAIALGVFGYGEILGHLGQPSRQREVFNSTLPGLVPTAEDLHRIWPAVLRGTALGSALGVLPGGGALLSAFAAHAVETKIRLQAGEVPLAKGNIRGVAAPEAASHAGAQTAFVPLLTLGIPTNAVMALLVGALALHGIQPGPQVMGSQPQLFWGLVASMWIANAMLVAINLPLAGLWAKLLAVPYRWLFPTIVLACALGAYCMHRNVLDIWLVGLFGVAGYAFIKLGCEAAPLLLGFILGPALQEQLREALLLSHGDWGVLATRPLSASLLAAAIALVLVVALPSVKARREQAFVEN